MNKFLFDIENVLEKIVNPNISYLILMKLRYYKDIMDKYPHPLAKVLKYHYDNYVINYKTNSKNYFVDEFEFSLIGRLDNYEHLNFFTKQTIYYLAYDQDYDPLYKVRRLDFTEIEKKIRCAKCKELRTLLNYKTFGRFIRRDIANHKFKTCYFCNVKIKKSRKNANTVFSNDKRLVDKLNFKY